MSDLVGRFRAARRRRRTARDSEHGAIAALLAVLLGGGVLLGMAAVVIDVGLLHLEREELQSGADAASYRVALQCARGETCTNLAQSPTALTCAQNNVKDKKPAFRSASHRLTRLPRTAAGYARLLTPYVHSHAC